MKKPTPKEGPITKALNESITLRRKLIDDGTPEAEADQIVGQGLKAVLGNARPESWRFYCANCHDTGWVNIVPSAEEMQRLIRTYGENPQHQGYVAKCEPCKWTQIEREKRRKQMGQDADEDDFIAAGKTKRRGDFRKLTS